MLSGATGGTPFANPLSNKPVAVVAAPMKARKPASYAQASRCHQRGYRKPNFEVDEAGFIPDLLIRAPQVACFTGQKMAVGKSKIAIPRKGG